MDRREFLKLTAAGFAATSLPLRVSAASAGIRVVLFDAFPVFDPRPRVRAGEGDVPGTGAGPH
jgi:2-haloacid dehalogenase